MKNLSPDEKKALRQRIRAHHEDNLARVAKEADEYDDRSRRSLPAMRTANPALRAKAFEGFGGIAEAQDVMSVRGTVNRAFILLALVFISAGWMWYMAYRLAEPVAVVPWLIGGSIGGFIFALITIFKKSWAPTTAPVYAVLEGLVLGGISSLLELTFPGIVIQAVGLTFGTLICLLLAYRSGIIKVTARFRAGVVAATGGIALLYLVTFLFSLFGVPIPFIHDAGVIGIGFSLFVVVIAALNLVLDFDFIEKGAAAGVPKYMEWYAAFGLMVTLIWLYLEILRLLSKLRRR